MKEEAKVKVITAKEFLASGASNEFKATCLRIGIDPTRRQVCKFRRKMGLAYQASQ